MRLILDTNILLSGLLSPQGAPAMLLDGWERNAFTLIASDALIGEFLKVASRPFFRSRLRTSMVELLAVGLRDFSQFYPVVPTGPLAPDPKDSFLLALAEISKADYLVTGDRALLLLKRHVSTRIVSAAQLVEIINKDR